MGKKKKKDIKVVESEKKAVTLPWIVAGIAVLAVVLAATGNLPFTGNGNADGKSFNLSGKETRPVLNPAMFRGQARAAYAAAQKYPEIMNEVFCYCYCDGHPFNHKTLLSCFADDHGAG